MSQCRKRLLVQSIQTSRAGGGGVTTANMEKWCNTSNSYFPHPYSGSR
jgi:hypothetical protein